MSLRTVTWSTTPFEAPAGTVGGNWLITMTGQPDQNVAVPIAIPYTLTAGDYVCTVSRLDVNGVVIGSPASKSFTVGATVDVPNVVTVG